MPEVLTERDAFLDAILASPDDDAPRLMYADWLMEHGQVERGEFIRIQCELASLPEKPVRLAWEELADYPTLSESLYDDEWGQFGRARELLEREQELLNDHGQEWANKLPGWFWAVSKVDRETVTKQMPGSALSGFMFRRGFVDEIHCRCEDWLAHGPDIVRQQPVRVVRLTDKEPWQQTYSTPEENLWCWISLLVAAADAETPLVSHVPACIYRFLKAKTPSWSFTTHLCGYDTPELANVDLSRACLKWAKEEAART